MSASCACASPLNTLCSPSLNVPPAPSVGSTNEMSLMSSFWNVKSSRGWMGNTGRLRRTKPWPLKPLSNALLASSTGTVTPPPRPKLTILPEGAKFWAAAGPAARARIPAKPKAAGRRGNRVTTSSFRSWERLGAGNAAILPEAARERTGRVDRGTGPRVTFGGLERPYLRNTRRCPGAADRVGPDRAPAAPGRGRPGGAVPPPWRGDDHARPQPPAQSRRGRRRGRGGTPSHPQGGAGIPRDARAQDLDHADRGQPVPRRAAAAPLRRRPPRGPRPAGHAGAVGEPGGGVGRGARPGEAPRRARAGDRH